MSILIISVPFRDGRFEPKIQTIGHFFIVGNSLYFEADTGLGKPDGVYFFQYGAPLLRRPVAFSEMHPERYAVQRNKGRIYFCRNSDKIRGAE
jgi:hypothetical protein